MCGRFALYSSTGQIKKAFAVDAVIGATTEITANYNIAPGNEIFAIIQQKERRMGKLHWGLVPPWAKNTTGTPQINARVETLHDKPSFRNAFLKKRCLIPASGFYEWKDKQPWYCTPSEGDLFGFAGIWETWMHQEVGAFHSCAIITTAASEPMRDIHDRMPFILKPEAFDAWLNPQNQDIVRLNQVLATGRRDFDVQLYPVSKYVDSPTNNDSGCIRPMAQ
jgi:putative SOS response-associated peptidase YedK